MNITSERIKKRREELELTLKQVAAIVGVSDSTILRWETGDIKNMAIDKVELLARALKCSPAFIMGWKEIEDKYDLIEMYDKATDQEKNEILSFAEFKIGKKKA